MTEFLACFQDLSSGESALLAILALLLVLEMIVRRNAPRKRKLI
jgi:hypothetical protein